jgi:DNA modification methylase
MPSFVERMDTRKLNLNKKFDSIITSPPYAILKLIFDLDFKFLEEDMIGNPRENKTQFEIPFYLENKLEKFKNRQQIFKFYSDIYLTIKK